MYDTLMCVHHSLIPTNRYATVVLTVFHFIRQMADETVNTARQYTQAHSSSPFHLVYEENTVLTVLLSCFDGDDIVLSEMSAVSRR